MGGLCPTSSLQVLSKHGGVLLDKLLKQDMPLALLASGVYMSSASFAYCYDGLPLGHGLAGTHCVTSCALLVNSVVHS